MSSQITPVRRALISVSDKTAVVALAQKLSQQGVELISTGGTYKQLIEAKIPVTEISDFTGFREIMDGRVKTLHPKVHGGILARRGQDDQTLDQHQILPIDLLIINLYPFEKTLANKASFKQVIENIDIGGPTMVRSAAKNFHDVTVLTDPSDYQALIMQLDQHQGTTLAFRFQMAQQAFARISAYDAAISNCFSGLKTDVIYARQAPEFDQATVEPSEYPSVMSRVWYKKQTMRYGENPHQTAAFYSQNPAETGTVAAASQLQGKPLSYNNIADADGALACVKAFRAPACVIVKHANPCGVACDPDLVLAYQKAFAADPTSAFGGIIAFNQEVYESLAQEILSKQFVEVIIAPSFSEAAVKVLSGKPNVRVLAVGQWSSDQSTRYEIKAIESGMLVQQSDRHQISLKDLTVVTQTRPSEAQLSDLMFAWRVCQYVKSNAIVYANQQQTVGIGAGQMSRVYSAKIASIKAREESLPIQGAVMASDAFFPFRDSVDQAAKEGVSAIIQPGGSIRDQEVIDAADEACIAMVFTGVRHFRH